MKVKSIATALLLAAACPPSAKAFYVEGGLGFASAKFDGTVGGVNYNRISGNGASSSLSIGWRLAEYLRGEIESFSFTSTKDDDTFSAGGLVFKMLADIPTGGIATPYVGLGAGLMAQEVERDYMASKSKVKYMPQYIAGIMFDPKDWKVGVGLEYRYMTGDFAYELGHNPIKTNMDTDMRDFAVKVRYTF